MNHLNPFIEERLMGFMAESGPARSVARVLAISMATALLSACAVGPDYVRPELPEVKGYIHQGAGADVPAPQADPEFWRNLGDPLLEQLVDAALLHNHDLRIALANYQEANALLRGAKFDRFPTVTADIQANNVRSSADQAPGISRSDRDHDDFQGNIGFTWELDLFGRVRRSIEAQRADTAASAEDLAAMQVAVVGQLARTYFQLRGLQEQLRIARENADNQSRTLGLLQTRFEAGTATPFDVDRGRTQLETTLSRTPSLEAQIAVATNRVAVLTGATPQALSSQLSLPVALPPLPERIVADAPSELLRRRPDVAAAERRLAAATARIGVATADLFPRFTLGGLIGTQAFDSGALFERDSETRLLSLGIDGSFLNVGRVRARIAAADATAAGNLATYERTVLVALEETENALVQLSRSGREAKHLEQASAAGVRAAGMARVRFEQGAIDVLELLDAENERLQAEDAYAQGRVRNTEAVVSLYQALAGGWPNHMPVDSVATK